MDRSPSPRRRFAVGLACAACALAGAATTASAATGGTGVTGTTGATGTTGTTGVTEPSASDPVLSTNWAGYAVTGSSAGARNFKHVAASWVQPTAACTPGSETFSAFWVGLGGISKSSSKLEQTGTEVDCDNSGLAHYSAWYELVPAAPVTMAMTISAGDSVSAAVTVHGAYVTFALADHTTGARLTKRLHFADANLSSAEWIAEAPSDCSGSCRALPLTDFGSVSFADSSVRSGNGRTGTISDPRWSAQAIELDDPASSGLGGYRVLASRDVATATPTVLDATGSSFSVTWGQRQLAGGSSGRFFPGD